MARKPKSVAPPSAVVGTGGATVVPLEAACLDEVLTSGIPAPDDILGSLSQPAGMWFTQQITNELLARQLKVADVLDPDDVPQQELAAGIVGPVLAASQMLTRACVVANILPAEYLKGMEDLETDEKEVVAD